MVVLDREVRLKRYREIAESSPHRFGRTSGLAVGVVGVAETVLRLPGDGAHGPAASVLGYGEGRAAGGSYPLGFIFFAAWVSTCQGA